jgi:hypothetical protein
MGIDFTWIAHAPLGRMAAISIQDDPNMAWHRPLFELIKQSALVNPIKKSQEQRCGRAFAGCFRSVGLSCRVTTRAEAVCRSKANVAACSWTGLQPGFISFTPHLAARWLNAKSFVPLGCIYTPTVAKMRTSPPNEQAPCERRPRKSRHVRPQRP